jgi:O-antigen ligase
MTALALPKTNWLRPVHVASVALVLAMLFSPVSQLTPANAVGKLPFYAEAALLVALLLRWLARSLQPRPTRPLIWIAVAIAHAMLTGLWAVDAHIFLTYGSRALHSALWTFAICSVIEDRDDLIAMLRVFHAVGCASAAVGIAQWILPSMQVDFVKENTNGNVGAALVWDDELGSGSIVRVTGTLAHPLGLALLLTCTLAWTPALLQAARTWRGRSLVITSSTVQLIGIALTYSRMAVLAIGVCSLLYIVRGGVKRPAAALAALLCAGIAGLPLLPKTLVERVFDPKHLSESDSLIARMEMQIYGSELGMEYGLWGVGYSCYGVLYEAKARGRYVEQTRWMLARDEYTAYDLGDVGAHNTYIEIWVEQGVPGLLLVICGIASLVIHFARRTRLLPRGSLDRNLGLCCEAGLLALIASTLVIHMQEAPMPWIWLGFACAWTSLPRIGVAL